MPAERLRHPASRRLLGALLLPLLAGCPASESTSSAPSAVASAPAPETAPKETPPAAGSAGATAPGPAGRITEGPLPLVEMLGSSPPSVESHLGEPFAKGMMRDSCVRFLPERTWFRCAYAWQRYQDRTGTFVAVQVAYENGKASAIALEGVPGEGPFDPRRALLAVGVELPGEPTESSPAPDAKLWSWFNAAARLVVHGRQFRVEVSSVGDRWDTSKVEIILNDPLTPEEREKIIETKSADQ